MIDPVTAKLRRQKKKYSPPVLLAARAAIRDMEHGWNKEDAALRQSAFLSVPVRPVKNAIAEGIEKEGNP